MTNAEKGCGIWSALRHRGVRCATIAFGVLLALFLTLVGFGCVDALAHFLGYRRTDEFSAGGRFTRDLLLALLALGGIAMAAWRNREMSRQADAARDQIENESNRIAGERFSDGVKMLAQNNENSKPAIAARIGGIYALQPLANNYVSQYAAQVVRILVAYVRENVQLTKIPYKDSGMNFLGEDVKAAFAVLAQLLATRSESPEKKFELSGKKFELSDNDLDFSDCNFSRLFLDYKQVNGLRHYRWQEADLQESSLPCADFRKARMYSAKLKGADLRGANLEGARLHNADLQGASLGVGSTDDEFVPTNLQDALLRNASLQDASFQDASLRGADLSCANLSRANLTGADLDNAKLQDTNFEGANLSGVKNMPQLSANQIRHSGQPEFKGVKSI